MNQLKAISIREPWASMIIGYFHTSGNWIPPKYRKDIENRDWKYKPSYRGNLLIHTSKTFEHSDVKYAQEVLDHLGSGIKLSVNPADYVLGSIIGRVYMNDVVEDSTSPWFFGKYGFKLRMPVPIDPIPHRGNLGFWEPEIKPEQITKIKKVTGNGPKEL